MTKEVASGGGGGLGDYSGAVKQRQHFELFVPQRQKYKAHLDRRVRRAVQNCGEISVS
jgi:hypothetical protein